MLFTQSTFYQYYRSWGIQSKAETHGESCHVTLPSRTSKFAPPLMPFYNEYATATHVQRRTSRDCRNQSEYIVAKKLQQQQIQLKLLSRCLNVLSSRVFILSSLVITSIELNLKKFLVAARSLASTSQDIFLLAVHFCYILRTHVAVARALQKDPYSSSIILVLLLLHTWIFFHNFLQCYQRSLTNISLLEPCHSNAIHTVGNFWKLTF